MESRPTHLILVDMEPQWVDVKYREILDDFFERRFDSLDSAADWCNSCQTHQTVLVTAKWFDQQMHSAIQEFMNETSTVVEVLVLTSGVSDNVWQSVSDLRIEILQLPSSPTYLEARIRSKSVFAKQRFENLQTLNLAVESDLDFDLCLASLVHEVSNFCQVLGNTVYLMSQHPSESSGDLDLPSSSNETWKSFELQKDIANLQSQINSLNLYVHSFADGLRSLQGQNNFEFKTWDSTLQKVVQVLRFQISESGVPRWIEYSLPTKFHSFYAHEGIMLFLLFNVVYNSVKHARPLVCLHVDISEKEVEIKGEKFVELAVSDNGILDASICDMANFSRPEGAGHDYSNFELTDKLLAKSSIGIQIVSKVVRSIGGYIDLKISTTKSETSNIGCITKIILPVSPVGRGPLEEV